MKRTNIGGQAVIEGVMMRGKKVYAMAVRTGENEITVEKRPVSGLGSRGLFRLPIFRGMAAFIDSLVIGTKILNRSAELSWDAIEKETAGEEKSGFDLWLEKTFGDKLSDYLIYFSVALSLVLGIALFMLLPVVIGNFLSGNISSPRMLGVAEGLLRMGIFLGYLVIISRMKDVKRLFQYHGAEHKTINCFENEEELTVENVRRHTRLHKRCGTSFLLIVMVVSMAVFFFVPVEGIAYRLLSRVILVPFVAGISYELIKWAGNSQSRIVGIISAPGLCLQRLTTAEPDDGQIETAISAMKGVLEDEGQA